MLKRETQLLPDAKWKALQLCIPITCVDVLLIREVNKSTFEIGLIYRNTPHQGRRWCLIGGRLFLNEPLRDAVARQVHDAIGKHVRCILPANLQPLFIAEYFSKRVSGSLFDPRKHAIGLTFVVQIQGQTQPQGEAIDFRWFTLDQLPNSKYFGFGQRKVVFECIQRFELADGCGWVQSNR